MNASNPRSAKQLIGALLCSLMSASPLLAGGGNVLPPTAQPRGYSLVQAAAATAGFNTGNRIPENLPGSFPFRILYVPPSGDTTFHIPAGTFLYIPVVYSDDVDAALWPYPDVNDAKAVSDYYFDPNQLGAEFIRVVVDGKVTELGPKYAVGAVTPGLPTGGNNYTVVALFLTPLSPGTHTVAIPDRFTGGFIQMYPDFFPGGVFSSDLTYTVIVGQ